MVTSVSSGLMLGFINYASKTDAEIKNSVFTQVSSSIGGDGRSISRTDLNSYLEKTKNYAEHNTDKTKLLKQMNTNWTKLFGDVDTITAEDFDKAPRIFLGILAEDLKKEDKIIEFKRKDEDSLYDKLKEMNNYDVENEVFSVTKKNLKDYLNQLLSENNNETENSDDIDLITNLIQDFDNLSLDGETIVVAKEDFDTNPDTTGISGRINVAVI